MIEFGLEMATAFMDDEFCCDYCGWPVVFACCYGMMGAVHPGAKAWMYCSNQACQHHYGEEWVGREAPPSFVRRIKQVPE